MSEEHEPYEVMPDGDQHAAQDYIAKIIAWLMLVLIVAVTASCPAHAAGSNWCGEWTQGFTVGYCWSRDNCDYIPPQMCPYPVDGETDGYMRGLNDGLSAGKVRI